MALLLRTDDAVSDSLSRDAIYWLLRHYPYLDGPTGPRPVDGLRGRPQVRDSLAYPVARYALRLAEINLLLAWLGSTGTPSDQWAALAIRYYYTDPEIAGIGDSDLRAATVAGLFGRGVSTIYRWIDHGVTRMARHTGWRPAGEEFHPFEAED